VIFPARIVEATVVSTVAVACAIGVLIMQQPTLQALNTPLNQTEYRRQEKAAKVTLDFLQKLPAFGFNNLVADWSFLQFIQYFGDTPARNQTGYSLVPEYFEVIVNKDPRFIDAYLYLSTACSIFAGRPDRTVALMNQGLKSLTPETSERAYYLWLYKAVDEILFIGDNQAAKRSYEKASQWAHLRGNQQIADQARQTAQFLSRNPDSKKVQASAWLLIFDNARDDYTRKLALTRIQALGGKIAITQHNGETRISVEMPKED
jgi:hypothetical protein